MTVLDKPQYTTVKVPVSLRDRINQGAQKRGISAARHLENLVAEDERRQRMEAFGKAFQTADEDYWSEFHSWDTTLSDGI